MKIGIDASGGDNAPYSIIDGIIEASKNDDVSEFIIYCNEETLKKIDTDKLPKNASIIKCTETISADDKPVQAIRKKKDSEIVKACNDLKEMKIDVFISAGNTGALLAAGTLISGRIQGIRRPALTTVFPTEDGKIVMLDVGANAECSAENLNQFAIMGSLYSEMILNTQNPSVSLVNIGVEKTKGTPLYQETYKLLEKNSYINFKGNIEARDVTSGISDVVIADGFTGNIILKTTEGVSKSIFNIIKKALSSSLKSKFGAFLAKDSFLNMKKELDYSSYGGAPLLGLKYPLVKAHGSSNAKTIKNAILYAKKYASSNLIETLTENTSKISN